MSSSHRVSKPWSLSAKETLTSFENWKSNIIYNLRQDKDFSPFIRNSVTWSKKKTDPLKRGLEDAGEKKAEDRAEDLEQMLGCIANWSTYVRRKTIVENSKCLEDVWQAIRLHYGFNTSGANFLDFADIKLEPEERGEDLYQRMAAFIDDNLLKKDSTLWHDGEKITVNEETTPTLENLIVLLWLEKLHPRLPALVKQKYATELRTKTLYSLKPEISMAIPSLLDEVKSFDEGAVRRTGGSMSRNNSYSNFGKRRTPSSKRSGECAFCKQAGRNHHHYLSQCKFLPEHDRKFLARTRRIMGAVNDDSEQESQEEEEYEDEYEERPPPRIRGTTSGPTPETTSTSGSIRRVMMKTSPTMNVFYRSKAVTITMDCGAELDLIRLDTTKYIGAPIKKSNQATTQLDGKTPLKVVGEVHLTFTRGDLSFEFSALVVEDMDVEILGAVPFLERNGMAIDFSTKEIYFRDGSNIKYRNTTKSENSKVRRATLVRATESTTVWPGTYTELEVPDELSNISELAVEPRGDCSNHNWVEPAIIRSVNGRIRIENTTSEPKQIKKHDHVIQVSPVFSPKATKQQGTAIKQQTIIPSPISQDHTLQISVDPDNLLKTDVKQAFKDVNKRYNEVFDPTYTGYNHAFGKFEAVVNMGNVKPPQRKGKLPQYSRDKLTTVQEHFDKLEGLGVLAKPESIGVNVEYLNPSFLVKKSDDNFRLVTAFTEVGRYCKPQPSALPTVDSTLRTIAHWNYLITTDLKSAYFQIPLSKESMKYCGTASPYKGTRVYTRCAMGMPGSETALEELLCRILGDLITKGKVTKLADDLYIGGDTQNELLENWTAVLNCFQAANIRLTGPKTVIAPKEVLVLGWIWNQGKLKASPHKVAALSVCPKPTSVKEMRSFLGAYKVLARVIPKCSSFLQPLSRSTAGKASHAKIEWSEELTASFSTAQKHLSNAKTINLPRESDQLVIVTDGATSQPAGIGSTLYVIRDSKPKLGGFFSQQLKPEQSTGWFPCEIEGLSIAAAVKFFSPYITQSSETTQVLTDSKPCCEAYQKLCRGEFSTNARLSTFLTTVSRHHVSISHLSGAANLPSDFGSRNPIACDSDKCQVCHFVVKLDAGVVRSISVSDVKSGTTQMPFTSRKAWLVTQSECPDLRRVKAQLLQGTRPSKKETTIPNVKKYLNKVTIASDGLLVVKKSDPLSPSREAIVVPAEIISGLMTALHIKLEHPSSNELFTIADRFFFALNMSKVIDEATKACYTCASLAKIPRGLVIQSSSDPPEVIGSQFACDVLKRERQLIMVIREYVSSFTFTSLIPSERHEDLRDTIIKLLVGFIPLDGPKAIVRIDPAPGFKTLTNDPLLASHRIHLDLGRTKNVNKNPVAEKAVQELEEIIQHHEHHNKAINDLTLAVITSRLNNKIRSNGLSAREVLTQRDQFSNNHLPLNDKDLIFEKHAKSLKAHQYSELSKSKGRPIYQPPSLSLGDLVHLLSDKSKHHPRERYIVTEIEGNWCQIRKFAGSQLRANPYKVPISDVYKVPSQASTHLPSFTLRESENSDEEPQPNTTISTPKEVNFTIPREICEIPSQDEPNQSDQDKILNTESLQEDEESLQETDLDDPTRSSPVTTPPRRSTRVRRPPQYLKDYQ